MPVLLNGVTFCDNIILLMSQFIRKHFDFADFLKMSRWDRFAPGPFSARDSNPPDEDNDVVFIGSTAPSKIKPLGSVYQRLSSPPRNMTKRSRSPQDFHDSRDLRRQAI